MVKQTVYLAVDFTINEASGTHSRASRKKWSRAARRSRARLGMNGS
jgi:hypothetical protein